MTSITKKYYELFSSSAGKAVIADLSQQFNLNRTSHTPGDPYSTAFKEGERNVVLHILATLQSFDPTYQVTLSELSLLALQNQKDDLNDY